jgi:hypothetical protein
MKTDMEYGFATVIGHALSSGTDEQKEIACDLLGRSVRHFAERLEMLLELGMDPAEALSQIEFDWNDAGASQLGISDFGTVMSENFVRGLVTAFGGELS